MLLTARDLAKSFAGASVLDTISLDVQEGEIVVLLGPSGCGKTTLLRLIAGLESPDRGELELFGIDLLALPVHQRGIGLVFQDYALFPHKDVFQNVAFGLRMLRWKPARIEARVAQVLQIVGLAGFESRSVHDLSGGERQRVALARSLAPAPRLLLLDEPLGALDRALREHLMLELRDILKDAAGVLGRPEGITAIYVTHDQAEAFAIADRIAVMNHGRIEQIGTPADLYQWPCSPFVARFLGMENILQGEVLKAADLTVNTPLGQLQAVARPGAAIPKSGDPAAVLIRPDAGILLDESSGSRFKGRLIAHSFRGRYQLATVAVRASASTVTVKLEFEAAQLLPPVGSEMQFDLRADAVILLNNC